MKKWNISAGDWFRHGLCAWCLAAAAEYICLPPSGRNLSDLAGLGQMSLLRVVLITLVLTGLLAFAGRFYAAQERWLLPWGFLILCLVSLPSSAHWSYILLCAGVMAGLLVYADLGRSREPEPQPCRDKSRVWLRGIVGLSALCLMALLIIWTVSRIYVFYSLTYDFGIFSQMFHYMKTTGLPLTTLERDGLLSHFHVHMSPIYYLMLPFYCIFPSPVTLQVLQAAVIVSAVIPLWKIARLHGLTDVQTALLCMLMLAYPAFFAGAGYDLHENCFLPVLLLWLFYGIDRESLPITILFGVLTLMVKEDAAVYVAVIGLWLTVRSLLNRQPRRSLFMGLGLLAGALLWFFLVTAYLARIGDGVMTYRYDNFMYDGSASLITVIQAVILHPLKALYECADMEKMPYLAGTLGLLLGLPLLTRRFERYLLLIPFVLINLMSDYPYQHNLFFQYNFGTAAMLLYLTAVNLADFRLPRRQIAALILSCTLCFFSFFTLVLPQARLCPQMLRDYEDHFSQIRACLELVPDGVPVTASTGFTTLLSRRDILYDTYYCTDEHMLSCPYVVLSQGDPRHSQILDILRQNGYSLWQESPGRVQIYKR